MAPSCGEAQLLYLYAGSTSADGVLAGGASLHIPGNTLYSFRAGSAGLRFLNFRARQDLAYITKDEFMARRSAGATAHVEILAAERPQGTLLHPGGLIGGREVGASATGTYVVDTVNRTTNPIQCGKVDGVKAVLLGWRSAGAARALVCFSRWVGAAMPRIRRQSF